MRPAKPKVVLEAAPLYGAGVGVAGLTGAEEVAQVAGGALEGLLYGTDEALETAGEETAGVQVGATGVVAAAGVLQKQSV